MHYDDERFEPEVQRSAERLMRGFLSWNSQQELLPQAGEENNFYEDVGEMRHAFQAIAERMVLEDVSADWEWLTTSWAGVDGNTGRSAYTIDFTTTNPELPAWAVLSFYVTCNGALWFATPLTEIRDPRRTLSTFEGLITSVEVKNLYLQSGNERARRQAPA